MGCGCVMRVRREGKKEKQETNPKTQPEPSRQTTQISLLITWIEKIRKFSVRVGYFLHPNFKKAYGICIYNEVASL